MRVVRNAPYGLCRWCGCRSSFLPCMAFYVYAYIRRKRTAAGIPWLLASRVEYKPFLIKHGGEDGEAMSVCLLTRYSRPL